MQFQWLLAYCLIATIVRGYSHKRQVVQNAPSNCSREPSNLHLSDPPYENYFYSDCNSSSQVVITSPLPDSNLSIIGPRLLIAWPAGNSGIVAFFAPNNGQNGSLAINIVNSTNQALRPVLEKGSSVDPFFGVSGLIEFNSSAKLSVTILGSIRTIRDFTEGPSLLIPRIQNATQVTQILTDTVLISRTWLDNKTESRLKFTTTGSSSRLKFENGMLSFDAGTYNFSAALNYPQLKQLSSQEVLNPASQNLTVQNPDQTRSLSFLSYENKLLAGAWRFLTYFGRDSMISLLLLQPVLSEGKGGAIEAVISAVLDRINQTDGSVCHEETIGDYATFLNIQANKTTNLTNPQYDYKMVDTDFFLPIVVQKYFVDTTAGQSRIQSFFDTRPSDDPNNANLTYRDLLQINAEKILNISAPFAASTRKEDLIRLKENEVVGNWRDSTYGIGGGRIPCDVNTALVPAALRAIAQLARSGFFPKYPQWSYIATTYARIWEDETLRFFEVRVPQKDARELVSSYKALSNITIPINTSNISEDVTFHGLALDGNNNQSVVRVMNTDDCFRHFLLNTTNQIQLSSFLSQTADHILKPFPIGLSTSIGLLVANPAYGGDPIYAANFTNNAYHGTVVWSWQLAMMAAGLERQLGRCKMPQAPDFCRDTTLYNKVRRAYNYLWDIIDGNRQQLSSEVWSWTYANGTYQVTPLGSLPPPPGTSPTESNIRQLWSLTFLAVKWNKSFV